MIGGAVWSYFQTISTRQLTYAPVVIIGSGLSIMYVMALIFITELIGENKVSVVKRFFCCFSRKQLISEGEVNKLVKQSTCNQPSTQVNRSTIIVS